MCCYSITDWHLYYVAMIKETRVTCLLEMYSMVVKDLLLNVDLVKTVFVSILCDFVR